MTHRHIPTAKFHASLKTKIILLTTVIVILIQGLNSVLEIAFLYKNIKANTIAVYQNAGGEVQKKLEKSLRFGKPLNQLDFNRLMQGLLPADITAVSIMDEQNQIIYQSGQPVRSAVHVTKEVSAIKYSHIILSFPLHYRKQVIGSITLNASAGGLHNRLVSLMRETAVNSLILLAGLLPLLYLLLFFFIDRPYRRSIYRLKHAFQNRDFSSLERQGMHLMPLLRAESQIDTLRDDHWLAVENQAVYENLKYYCKIGDQLLNQSQLPDVAFDQAQLTQQLQQTQNLLSEYELSNHLRRLWRQPLEESATPS